MKKITSLLVFIALLSFTSIAQTGQGVTLQLSSPTSFSPTNVDSTSYLELIFTNSVNSQQIVTFSNLSLPFDIQSSITIDALDSDTIQMSFSPTLSGNFSDSLIWNANIFGSGLFVVNGEGVQVILTTSTDSLDLGTISLGTNVTDSFMLSNTGTGTMLINNITSSNSYFSVSPTSGTLAQGANMYVSVTFAPLMSGLSISTISIESNDPNFPVYNVNVQGTGISEISGALCGTLSLANSPYTLIGDITVADTCVLTIEAGVEIYGSNYGMYVDGTLNAVGTASDSIRILTNEIILANANGHDSLSFISTYLSNFEDDFEVDNLSTNWSYDPTSAYIYRSSSYSNPSDFNSIYGANFGSNNTSKEFISEPFTCVDNNLIISWEYRNTSNNAGVVFKYRVNGGIWQDLTSSFSSSTTTWYSESHDISSDITIGDDVEFMVFHVSGSSGYQNTYMDNFAFNAMQDQIVISSKEGVKLSNSTIFSKKLTLSGSQYKEDFSDCQFPTGWSSSNSVKSFSNFYGVNGCGMRVQASNADDLLITSSFVASTSSNPVNLKFKINHIDTYCYLNIQYDINGSNNWTNLQSWNWSSSNNINFWNALSYNIPSTAGDNIRIRFFSNIYSTGSSYNDINYCIDDLYVTNGYDTSFVTNSNIKSSIINYQDLFIDSCNISPISNQDLITTYGSVYLNNSILSGNNLSTNGIYSTASDRNIRLFNSTIKDFNSYGIYTYANNSEISLQYSFVKDNVNTGIYTAYPNSHVNLNSSMVSGNGNYGIKANGQVNLNYSNITFNTEDGIYLTGNNFSNIKNSIIWGNDIYSYTQIQTSSGVTSITYSTVQGSGAYGTAGSQYYFGDGSIDDDPVFSDPQQHMSPFSTCVDAGTPWEVDANMPYGLGGVRADIGIYGGPDNWFWGGTPVPDGSPVLTSIEDSPQDQGSIVGVLFDASVWDNSALVNNVTHYAIWRNFDTSGNSIDSVEQGNWQLMGDMPAQSFNAYAFEAPTLGDSSIANGMFNNCYIVVAHTADSSTFWYSNVLCGYSTDDLAPSAPIVSSMVDNSTQDVIVYWDSPQVSDYSSSSVFSLSGFSVSGVTDTLTADSSPVSGSTYTYGVIHYDVNGNSSDTAWTTITIDDGVDVIPLNAGWNLISTNHTPNDNNMIDIFSSLLPNNLVYVTSFHQGSYMYNPNGPTFLNTLNQFTDGYAYWVKVTADDTLRITGLTIDPSYKIPLDAGWNLSGYMNTTSQSPNQYLGDLISNNNLVYCTSFNQGVTLFNPGGLSFLNTLNSMQRPFGYWIKVNNPVNSNQYRLQDDSGNKFSPYFMFVNGKSNLENFQGEYIDVLNSDREVLNRIEILKGGYLMTTPLYGDDPETDLQEGFLDNENLIFSFNGQDLFSSVNFNGNMELKELDLNFSNFGSFNIYPNPSKGITNINFFTYKDVNVKIHVYDVTGRMIHEVVNNSFDKGSHLSTWNATDFDKGIYLIKLLVNDAVISSERVVIQ